MNFDFSDDQKQLRDQARKFLAEKCSPKAVRVVLDPLFSAYFRVVKRLIVW